MAQLAHKAGINAQRGEVTNPDVDAFRAARLGAVRLRTGEHTGLTAEVFRSAGAFFFNAVVTLPDMGTVTRSPERFVNETLQPMRILLDAGVGSFELGYQPNTALGGYGLSWRSPHEFAAWFDETARRFRAALPGRQFRIGFPALAITNPSTDPDPVAGNRPRQPILDVDFLEQCRTAVERADFIACISTWSSTAMMRDINGGLRWLRYYHERFPDKPLVLAEFSNNNPINLQAAPESDVWRAIGAEYAEFYSLCMQYEFVEAAYAQILRDRHRPHESWLTEESRPRRVVEELASRAKLPEPAQLALRWPTEFQRVNQPYGVRQLDYSNFSEGALRGGHEGIDLAAPDGSRIFAALDGRVVFSGPTTGRFNGYGAYGEVVVTETDVADVGNVQLIYAHFQQRLVQTGQWVQAGQVVGLSDATGNAQGAHLHLSLRIAGIDLPVQRGYLNPGLYLNAPQTVPKLTTKRGAPRMAYERSYVLLPPDAGLEWMEAALRASWQQFRYTVGGSADDAGVGDLPQRRVIAINDSAWGDDLQTWYERHYNGVDYRRVNAQNPAALVSLLQAQQFPLIPPRSGIANRGQPRTEYERAYVLLPPRHGLEWALAAARSSWLRFRPTIGGSADDAGIGDLDSRTVIAVNPTVWGGGDLQHWYNSNYPGVRYFAIEATTPLALQQQLAGLQI